MTSYRIVCYCPNPFSGLRIPLGAIVYTAFPTHHFVRALPRCADRDFATCLSIQSRVHQNPDPTSWGPYTVALPLQKVAPEVADPFEWIATIFEDPKPESQREDQDPTPEKVAPVLLEPRNPGSDSRNRESADEGGSDASSQPKAPAVPMNSLRRLERP